MNNVKDFGAVGDGKTSDTLAIQRAIDAGGEVYFPKGVYKTGTIYLRSHGGIVLEKGATLQSGGDEEIWNAPDFCPENRTSVYEKNNGRHLIAAYKCEDISIRGGHIDGNCFEWYNELSKEYPYFELKEHNGQMIFLCECENVRIQDCELTNSPYWHCFLHGCNHVFISGIYIHSNPMVHCNDGIDLDCCTNVVVSNCIIETGDDALTLRGNSAVFGNAERFCENITVTNCILEAERADGIRIGVGNGAVRNCSFSDIIIKNSNIGIELAACFTKDKGVDMENIEFSNIRMNAYRPFQILTGPIKSYNEFFTHEVSTSQAFIRNITFNNIKGEAQASSRIRGNFEKAIDNIEFNNVKLDFYGKGEAPYFDAEKHWDKGSCDCAYRIKETGKITFKDCAVVWRANEDLWKSEIDADDAEICIENCNFPKNSK